MISQISRRKTNVLKAVTALCWKLEKCKRRYYLTHIITDTVASVVIRFPKQDVILISVMLAYIVYIQSLFFSFEYALAER